MSEQRVGIIVNGATGSLARIQHLGALKAIRAEGGLALANGIRLIPDPMLVGRNAQRLGEVASETGIANWTTDLDAALSSSAHDLFFDAATPAPRFATLGKAIAAGKHLYCEKPVATTLADAMHLVRAADRAAIKHGTVQDKLFLPGFATLKSLVRSGRLGRPLEVRVEMGFWVFDGFGEPMQRASWNYRAKDGGGIMLDMFPHWRYMLEGIVGTITAISATHRVQVPRRVDEAANAFDVDADDSVFAKLEIEGSILASVNCSWSTRVRRDATIMVQIDGTDGSAVATPTACFFQSAADTPRLGRTSDGAPSRHPSEYWETVTETSHTTNSYRAGWELFLRHVYEDAPFEPTLLAGARGVQLAELGYQSHHERRWIDVPRLT